MVYPLVSVKNPNIFHLGVLTSIAGAFQQKYSKELGPVGLAVRDTTSTTMGLFGVLILEKKNSPWPIFGEIW